MTQHWGGQRNTDDGRLYRVQKCFDEGTQAAVCEDGPEIAILRAAKKGHDSVVKLLL